MNDQEAFEKVYHHLLAQNKRAQRNFGSVINCAYRGDGGLKCAIGCLITDEEYFPKMDNDFSLFEVQCACPSLRGLSYSLLTRLQQIHDGERPEDWHRALIALARDGYDVLNEDKSGFIHKTLELPK